MSSAGVLLILFAFVYLGTYALMFSHVSRQITERGLSGVWYLFAIVHPIWALVLMPRGPAD